MGGKGRKRVQRSLIPVGMAEYGTWNMKREHRFSHWVAVAEVAGVLAFGIEKEGLGKERGGLGC